jgi:Iodothyronine deiodinase/EF hand
MGAIMKSNCGFPLIALLSSYLGLALPTVGWCADDDTPRPGQLKGILSALKKDGDARTRQGADWLMKREYVAHLLYLATDTRGNIVGSGMYHPSQVRYGWDWLRLRCDKNGDGEITLAEFGGPREWFEALDKDHDGVLTKDDFDWASGSPLATAQGKASALFERIDRDGNGRASPEEWKLWFDSLSGGKDYLSQDDLIPLFLEPKRRGGGKAPPTRSRLSLICAYLSGDVGPLSDGPSLDEIAPDFTLTTADGKGKLSLSQHRSKKPQVLVFGSFTCNRYRAQSGDVENLYRHYKNKVDFIAVYIREAHPTDGWSLTFNERVGISIAQPKAFEDRRTAAGTCCTSLKTTIPMVVDEIDDRAGIAYCGMPDRLYILDTKGRVAYKGGRGPFGYKPLEMEQALITLLMAESQPQPKEAPAHPTEKDR